MFGHFCAARSKDHLSQFWEELDHFQGGVAIRLNTVLFKMAATVMGGVLL